MMTRALLMTGGNRADSRERLAEALRLMERNGGRVVRTSKVYTTASWGFEADDFVNQAVELETALEPLELLDAMQAIERQLGRDRRAEADEKRSSGQRYASRPVDIDILFYGECVVSEERLTIPHRAIAERRFVLEPLDEIAPEKRHPLTGLSVHEMLLQLKEREEREER